MTKRVITAPAAPGAIGPYSHANMAGRLVFCSGQLGLNPATGALVAGGVQAQTRQALTNLSNVLAAAGATLSNAVKTTVFLATMDDFAAMNAVYGEFFPADPPARTTVGGLSLPKGALVEIELVAEAG
jgi:2-iminobutanoate/2-iminopropanoate deaminase